MLIHYAVLLTLVMNIFSRKSYALLALMIGSGAIGFSPIFVRLSETGPTATALWRFIISLPAMWLWMKMEDKKTSQNIFTFRKGGLIALAGLFFATDLAVWHLSLMKTSVAASTVISNVAPIFVAFGGWIIYKQRPGLIFVLGMVIALAGIILLVGEPLNFTSDSLQGNLLALLASLFYGSYLLVLKTLRSQFSTGAVIFWGGLATIAALLPLTLVSGEKLLPDTPYGWWVLVGLALVCQVFGQSLIAYGFAYLSAAFSAVTLWIQPIVATMAAWVIFNEDVNLIQGIGGVLILFGIFIAGKDPK